MVRRSARIASAKVAAARESPANEVVAAPELRARRERHRASTSTERQVRRERHRASSTSDNRHIELRSRTPPRAAPTVDEAADDDDAVEAYGQEGRKQRALHQRLYLVGRRDAQDDHDAGVLDYVVMGSTGNIYYPTLSVSRVGCTCMDQRMRRTLCKHLIFVLMRVLKLPSSHRLVVQAGAPHLSQSDLDNLFDHAQRSRTIVTTGVIAPQRVREEFARAAGVVVAETGEVKVTETGGEAQLVAREIGEGDECPICYEAMMTGELKVWCRASCRRSMHKECFDRWAKARRTAKETVTCVYCRHEWQYEATITSTNLADFKKKRMNLNAFA